MNAFVIVSLIFISMASFAIGYIAGREERFRP